MKKLIIIYVSVLLSMAAYAGTLTSDLRVVERAIDDKTGNSYPTWHATYTDTKWEMGNLKGLEAFLPQANKTLFATEVESVDLENDQVTKTYLFTWQIPYNDLQANLKAGFERPGELEVEFVKMMDRGLTYPNGETQLSAEASEKHTLLFGEQTKQEPNKPEPKTETVEQPNNVPAPPTVDITREVVLYTPEELEEAKKEAASVAYEQGVSAVLSDPKGHGLKVGTQKAIPFVKGWCYVENLEWVYVPEDLFPFIYSEKLASWILVQQEEEQIRYFIYQTQKWLSYSEMTNL